MMPRFLLLLLLTLILLPRLTPALPPDFDQTLVAGGLQDPATMAFAPDGRLFVGERIQGHIRIIEPGGQLLPEPFLTLDVPNEGSQPEQHRSSGVRGFAFDPDYADNGYFYVFYMKQFANGVRHNRISRFTTDPNDPDKALPGSELVLMELPFNSGGLGGSGLGSSGSHNGGAVTFGGDGKLYFTTGDGWNSDNGYNQGDNVQSLSTHTGKLYRLDPDGSIPTDNPFYNTANGDFRAIYALGLRNPYSMTTHPITGEVWIFDVGTKWSGDKDYVYRAAAGANYGHDAGSSVSIGTLTQPWAYTGSRVISGGAFYYADQFPPEYFGNLFVSGFVDDDLRRINSDSDPTVTTFATDEIGNNGPLYISVGPDGSLYYLHSTYTTSNGEIYRISYTGTNAVSSPVISPLGGTYIQSVDVGITSFTPDTTHYYTFDGSDPTESSTLYTGPIQITQPATLRVRGYKAGLEPSQIVSATFTIDPGTPPAFTSTAEPIAVLNSPYHYDADATGLPAPVYHLDLAPPGMTIDPASGEIDWTPGSTGDFDVTVRAANGIAPDAVQSFTISVLDVRAADQPGDLVPGLQYTTFDFTGDYLPDYRLRQARSAGTVVMPDLSVRERDDHFVLRFHGYLEIPTTGDYTFTLISDEGAAFFIGDTLVVDGESTSPAEGSIGLEAGFHRISLEYYEGEGTQELELRYSGPGIAETSIPAVAYHRDAVPFGLDQRHPSPAYLQFPEVENGPMPTTLSATGAFADVTQLIAEPGVVPYGVTSPLWSDDAAKDRWISLPSGSTIDFDATAPWVFPPGTVFIKHFELGTEGRRLETRFTIIKEDLTAYGVTYRWRSDHSDADLVPASGLTEEIVFDGGKRQTWVYPSRADCLECHNPSTYHVLGVRTGQLNRLQAYPTTGVTDEQLRTWRHLDFFTSFPEVDLAELETWVPVDDAAAPLETRFKSYLAANCAFCHNPARPMEGADFDGRFDTALDSMGIIGVAANNDLGVAGRQLIKPQDPHLSALYLRIDTNDDAIQMPPLARNAIDPAARDTLLEWILSLDASTSADVPDYQARWRFDGDLLEENGNADGSWRAGGTATFQPGTLNQAVDLDGSNDAVDLGPYDIDGNAVTFSFWFQADDFGVSDARFISKATGSSDADHDWMVSTLNSTRLRFRLKTNGTTTTLFTDTGIIATDTWHHVAAVYDGATMALYRDGELVASTPKSGSIATSNTVSAAIGNQPADASGGARPFDGRIDDLRIYHRALDPAEIETVRTAGSMVNAAPVATITSPAVSPSSWVTPASVTFEGTGSDLEDGDVTASARWISSLDGLLHEGPSFTATDLTPGTHQVVLTTTDSQGASGAAFVTVEVLTPYQHAMAGYGLTGDLALPFRNLDGDPWSNLLEIFLGGHPLEPDSTLTPIVISGSASGIEFRRALAALPYDVEVSFDLVEWFDASTLPGYLLEPAGQDPDGVDRMRATLPTDDRTEMFFRIEVPDPSDG